MTGILRREIPAQLEIIKATKQHGIQGRFRKLCTYHIHYTTLYKHIYTFTRGQGDEL